VNRSRTSSRGWTITAARRSCFDSHAQPPSRVVEGKAYLPAWALSNHETIPPARRTGAPLPGDPEYLDATSGTSTAIGQHRGVSNPTGLHRHIHLSDTRLVACDAVLPCRERKLEVEGPELGLFDHDPTVSINHDLHGMRRCARKAGTFLRHPRNHAGMRALSLRRCGRASAVCDGESTCDTEGC